MFWKENVRTLKGVVVRLLIKHLRAAIIRGLKEAIRTWKGVTVTGHPLRMTYLVSYERETDRQVSTDNRNMNPLYSQGICSISLYAWNFVIYSRLDCRLPAPRNIFSWKIVHCHWQVSCECSEWVRQNQWVQKRQYTGGNRCSLWCNNAVACTK